MKCKSAVPADNKQSGDVVFVPCIPLTYLLEYLCHIWFRHVFVVINHRTCETIYLSKSWQLPLSTALKYNLIDTAHVIEHVREWQNGLIATSDIVDSVHGQVGNLPTGLKGDNCPNLAPV